MPKIVCESFKPIRTEGGAKVICQYYQKSLCSLPKNFLCTEAERRKEVKKRQWHSYSSINTFLSCQRKYYYQYILGLEPVERPEWAIRGNKFHEILAGYYSEGTEPAIQLESEIDSIVVPMTRAYIEFYNDKREGLQIEQKFSIDNPPLVAYVDVLDRDTIIDHKFSKSEPSSLSIGFQASVYRRVTEAEKFMVNFVKVPQLQRKKEESLVAFAIRIYDSVKESPNKYFNRTVYNLDSEFYLFDSQIETIIEKINSMVGKYIDYYFMNPSSCGFGGCDFKDICLRKTIDETKFRTKGE